MSYRDLKQDQSRARPSRHAARVVVAAGMFHRFRHIGPRARLPSGERVYVIADVHGEARLLQQLLSAVDRDTAQRGPASVMLVLLGDVIDRGAHSADLLRALHGLADPSFLLLKGNHEAMFVDSYRGSEDALDLWLRVGGRSTLIGFGVAPETIDAGDPGALVGAIRSAIDPVFVDWLDGLPTAWSRGDYFFAHAGIRPGVRFDRQRDDDLLWIRGPFLSSRADHGKIVVHGHSVEPGIPRLGGNRIGLDTGAHEHRRLTALGLEDDRQWLLQESDLEADLEIGPDAGGRQANRTVVRPLF